MSGVLAERWCHCLANFPDLKMRADYLRAQLLSYSTQHTALALRELFQRATDGFQRVHPVIASLVPALAHPSGDDVLSRLETFSREAAMDDLADWLGFRREHDDLPDQALAGAALKSASDRPLTLGERKTLARHPNRQTMARLMADPDPVVIDILLGNPAFPEDRVVRLAAKRPGRSDILRLVASHPKWVARPMVRSALVQNPHTPGFIASPLVCLLVRPILDEILEAPSTRASVRRAAMRITQGHGTLG